MENHLERAVEATIGAERGAEGVSSEKRKQWVAPELRKFEIAEVTAAHPIVANPDAALGAS